MCRHFDTCYKRHYKAINRDVISLQMFVPAPDEWTDRASAIINIHFQLIGRETQNWWHHRCVKLKEQFNVTWPVTGYQFPPGSSLYAKLTTCSSILSSVFPKRYIQHDCTRWEGVPEHSTGLCGAFRCWGGVRESYLKTLLETESCLLSNMASFCCQEEVCVSIYSCRSQTAASKTPHRKKKIKLRSS